VKKEKSTWGRMEDGLGWRYASFNAILYYSINSHHPHFILYFPSPFIYFSLSVVIYVLLLTVYCVYITMFVCCINKDELHKKFSISPAHTHIKCSCSLASVFFIPHTYTLIKKYPTPTHTHIQHESSHTDKKVSNSNKNFFVWAQLTFLTQVFLKIK